MYVRWGGCQVPGQRVDAAAVAHRWPGWWSPWWRPPRTSSLQASQPPEIREQRKFNQSPNLKIAVFEIWYNTVWGWLVSNVKIKKIEIKVFLAIFAWRWTNRSESGRPKTYTDPDPEHCHILKKYLRIQKTVALAVWSMVCLCPQYWGCLRPLDPVNSAFVFLCLPSCWQ